MAIGSRLDLWPMNLLEPLIGGFSLRVRKERELTDVVQSLKPGQENTLLILAHGGVSPSLMYPYRFFEASLTEREGFSLETLLYRIMLSGSAFTHLIFESCNSGQLVEDFMSLQRTLPQLTRHVNIYIPVGRYQLHYPYTTNKARRDAKSYVRLVPTSSLEASLGVLMQGIEKGNGIAAKAIISGKVYDPLKAAIRQARDRSQDSALSEQERAYYQTLLTELRAIRKITESLNLREVYNALLAYKELHPQAVTNLLSAKAKEEGLDELALKKYENSKYRPTSYTLVAEDTFSGSDDYPRVIIPKYVADFVAQVAAEEFGQLLPQGHFAFRKAPNQHRNQVRVMPTESGRPTEVSGAEEAE